MAIDQQVTPLQMPGWVPRLLTKNIHLLHRMLANSSTTVASQDDRLR